MDIFMLVLISFIIYITISVKLHYGDYIYCLEKSQGCNNIIDDLRKFIKQNKWVLILNIVGVIIYILGNKCKIDVISKHYNMGILVITMIIIFIPRFFKNMYKSYYFTKDYRYIYILNFISSDYSVSLYYKNRLEREIKFKNDDKRKQILNRFNHTNLFYTIFLFIYYKK